MFDRSDKGEQVLWPSTRDHVAVAHDLFIQPCRACIDHVVTDAWPGGQRAALDTVGGGQDPWTMAQRGDRFVALVKPLNKCPSTRGLTQKVGVDESAGQQQPVISVWVGLGHRVVDMDSAGGLMKIHAPDAASPEGNNVDLGSREAQGCDWDRQFELFKPVCRKHGDAPASQASTSHDDSFIRAFTEAQNNNMSGSGPTRRDPRITPLTKTPSPGLVKFPVSRAFPSVHVRGIARHFASKLIDWNGQPKEAPMQHKAFVLSCTGGLLLVFTSAAYAADAPDGMTVSPPPEAASGPADASVTPPADSTVAPADAPATPSAENTAPAPDQVSAATDMPSEAIANPSPQERMAADSCADKAAAAGSLDCEKLKRRLDPQASQAKAATCLSHMDAKGNVVYDDPTCPSRMGAAVVNDPNAVYLIRENPFFNLHIEKAVDHARAAELAGNQGQAIDLLEHAQMSLIQAKEAQRAGNVAGLNEGISSLREALRLPETSSIREATAYVRDARKNLSQAGGIKYAELQPKGVVAVSTDR